MKNIIVAVLVVAMAVIAGCGNGSSAQAETVTVDTSKSTTVAAVEYATITIHAPNAVGVQFDLNGLYIEHGGALTSTEIMATDAGTMIVGNRKPDTISIAATNLNGMDNSGIVVYGRKLAPITVSNVRAANINGELVVVTLSIN